MKKIEVCEIVKRYHVVEVEDEVDMEAITANINHNTSRYENGREALETALNKIKDACGLDYVIHEDCCGTELDELCAMGEVD